MPLPLPLRSSKHETKKSQSSKIVPNDHGQFEKRGENYQAKVSPSSPQGPLKKRSALEDLTNASQSQPAQPKKEANKEFVKDISKKINRNTPALGLAKNNEMDIKKYELEPSSVAVTTMVLTFVEKPLSVNISTISKTPTTEEASLLKTPLVLKKKPNTGDTIFTKRSLSLKKHRHWNKVFEEPLSLLEETESDLEFVSEPVTFGNQHKTEKAAFAKKTLSFTKLCTCQGKQSCCGKDLTSLDINVDKESFMEPENFRKKPETEEATSTKKLLTLNKCTTQENMFHRKKPLILRKATSGARLRNKEPFSFEKKPITEEFFFQEPSLLQEKHTTQGKVSISKKPLDLQKIPTEEESLLKEPLAFKKKRTIEEATPTEVLVFVKKRRSTADRISCLKKPLVLQTISEEKSLIKELLSFKKKPTTEEEFLFKESSVLPEKHTTQGEVSILNKPLALQKTPTEERSLLKEPLAFKKKRTIEEATPNKELVFVKKKHTTEDKISCLKKPLVLQTVSEEKSLIKEPLSFKKKPTTEEEFLFKESSVLPEKHTTQGEVSILNKPLALQKTPTEEESLSKEPLVFKKCTSEEATPTKELVFVKKKCATEDKISCLKKPLELQTISEEKSLIKESLSFKKKPTTEEEFLFKESSVLPEKHTTQGEVALVKKPWTLQENIHSKDEFLMEPVSFREKHTTNEAVSSKEPLSLQKKRYTTQITMSICQEMLDLKNMIGKDKYSFVMEPVTFRKKSSTEEAILTKTLLSLKKKQVTQGEMFLLKTPLVIEKTTSEEESLFKKVLPFGKKTATDKDILCQDPSVLKEEHSTLKEVSHSGKPLALQEKTTTEEESYIKEPLEEQPTTEEEFLFQEQFSLHVKPTNKDESIFWKALNMQNKTEIKEDPLKKLLTSQEKSTTEEGSLLKKPLVLKKKVSTEATTSVENQLSLEKSTAQGEMFLLKKQLSLQENITSMEDFLIKQPLALQQKPSIEKESISEELAFQGKLTINEAFHFKMSSLNEKPTTGQELSFEKPLALQDNSTQKKDTFLKDFSILQLETSSHVFNTAPESRTSMSSSGTMSSVRKFNTTKKSSACKSSSNKLFSSWGKRSHKEVTILEEIDESHYDPYFNLVYAKDIFRYMKEREEKFILRNYMKNQTDISSDMRAILVNWLVEVQITFELNHETLYLAVKLVDHYLMKKICKKEKLQLLGSTAFLIAAKFEESYPPGVDDFLYLCNDAYQRDEMLAMEISILQTLKFDINIPVAYHFLRRYSVCVRVNMNAVILSRFICELTLQEYDYIQERASKLAAGSFLLALHMKKLGCLAPTLEYYSGYTTSDLYPLVKKLNMLLSLRSCDDRLKSVRSKYSHQLFFEVTKTPPLDMLKLEEILNSC
ncbi:G2/mitotic-specific cyclin-B3 [Molossus molossus]|uniref:Cyclin B3 n=1 Tax=Molossus molossus TaxID=27622 RepID=A0A7J8J4P6_MOLMO|nr:G2/mitotic-specific cyclin-B3 [Molossus molossus]XP_036127296.1 G2/mitotic-specific cyclin-B3 [Molossus molossus]XP_036127297.1 G2/mitotic-specific cyclin-B3 [Molossus molossus]KAF6491854.1 cyclin B3 [Molossus molossus]